MDKYIEHFQKLKLWQVLMVLGIAAPASSHYGWNIPESYALMLLPAMIGVALIVRYFPPPQTERRKRETPRIAVSAHQSGFCSQFDEWTSFDEAAKAEGPEDHLKVSEAKLKCRELRIEIGTSQGLLERKIENGVHYVRSVYGDDATTFVPN